MTTLDCKQKHGIIKKILVKCAGKSVCCPPLEELELSESETEFTPTEHETSSIGLETTQTDLNLIPVEKCGRRPQYDRMKIFDFGNKVFKGKRVTIGEIPWIVHITAIGNFVFKFIPKKSFVIYMLSLWKKFPPKFKFFL